MRTLSPLLALVWGFVTSGPSDCSARGPDILRTNLVSEFTPVVFVSFSPDGALLAVGMNKAQGPAFTVCLGSNLVPLWPPGYAPEGGVPTAASFHSRFVAVGTLYGAAGVGTLDQQYGIELSSAESPHLNFGTVVAFSPLDETYPLIVHAGLGGVKKTRVYGTGIQTTFPNSYQGVHVTAIAWEAGATTFLLGNDRGTVQRWQVEPPQLLWQTNFPNHRVAAINVLSNGPPIVTLVSNTVLVRQDHYLQDVRLWAVGATNWLQTIRPDLAVFSTALTPDGRYLFTVLRVPHDVPPYNPTYYTNHVALWRVSDGKVMVRYDEDLPDVEQVAVAPDGKTFAYGRGDGIVAIARMPTVVTKVEKRAEEFKLDWQGGSGLYQVQTTSNVVQGPWAALGPATTNTSFTVPLTNPAAFFRIQSLSNAP